MNDKPGLPGRPCDGERKDSSEREFAIEVIGRSVELATSLKARLDAPLGIGKPPIAPHRPGFDLDAWRMLAAYLIEERRLVEFLLGPGVYKRGSTLRYRNPNDICLDCFRPPDGRYWRFPEDEVRIQLRDRADRINKRLTHFSWTLIEPDTRLDAGIWSTKYLDQVVDGLWQLSDWLETTGSPLLAETLRRSMGSDAPRRQA